MKVDNMLIPAFLCAFLFSSCSEDINFHTKADNPIDEIEIRVVVKTPCEFSLNNVTASSTVVIDCLMDLNGETVILPENVNLDYDGGAILNGKLVFSGGKIDGKLLNHLLELEGNVALKDDVFFFNPNMWNIIEGETTFQNAVANKDKFNHVLTIVSELGGKTFEIDKLNAFFSGEYYGTEPARSYNENSLRIPSDFHLKMSDNTFLNVYPTNNPAPRLIGMYLGDNIEISGGNLVGDRYAHDYSPVKDVLGVIRDSHEFGTLIYIAGSTNINIHDVHMTDSSGDGFAVAGSAIRNPDGTVRNGHKQAENIVLSNCIVNASRRNNISLIDGEFITIENCVVSKAGGGTSSFSSGGAKIFSSAGVAPQFGIDLEAYRERGPNNEFIEYERIQNVVIRENQFIGNHEGDIVLYTTNSVLVENNTMDNRIGANAAFNCKIINNKIVARTGGVNTSRGINFNSFIKGGEELLYDIEVLDNYISGFDTAISVGGNNITVAGNTVKDFKEAIYISTLRNSKIHDNVYEGNRAISYGYFTNSGTAENVKIYNDRVITSHRPLFLNKINDGFDGTSSLLTLDNCEFSAGRELYLSDSKHISIKNSKMNTEIQQKNCQNILLENNLLSKEN